MNEIRNLNNLMELINEDAKKFYEKSNKSAGTRLRKNLQELKLLSHSIRKDVASKRKASV